MKIGFNKVFLTITLLLCAIPAFAMPGSIIAATMFAAGTVEFAITAFAINMVASSIITKAFFSPSQPASDLSGSSPNPGNRQQVPPATDNKLPVVYGQAWLGGTIIDLSISNNNQELYYVVAICEVTNNGADTITFGDVYYGGKKCSFASPSSPNVISLTDESTGNVDTNINGKLQIYLYRNGSYNPVNTTLNAIQVMQTSGLVYTWNSAKLMTNCAFAIVHITYNPDAGTTGLQQTKFQVTNSRHSPGDCFLDYLTNDVYGAAIPLSQINTSSLTALDVYSNESFTYTTYGGVTTTQTRFRFDGVLDTNRSVMDNLQSMASCCDCLLKYNEITGQWGTIVLSPTYSVAMALDDSNLVSAISISPLDIVSSYNIIECKFPDKTNQDSFNSTTFDLAEIDPALLFPNEPVNKQSVNLPLVNNSVRAQYIAIRMLKAGREDLQVQVNVNYSGIQLEAGDIVSITNVNYGWVAKLFQVNKVIEEFASTGAVIAKLTLSEFNPAVYNDQSITEFQPSPNTGIPDPLVFGTVPTPTIGAQYPTDVNPLFMVNLTASSAGIIQYAEVWYSAFSTPTEDQLIFGGTTAIQSNGTPYAPGSTLPPITLANIPAGTWYFFSRMVNSLGTSNYSLASSPLVWKPTTFQYGSRYLDVAYADDAAGTSNFSFDPTNRLYYGLSNVDTPTLSTDPTAYTWYLADPSFGTNKYLCFANRSGRKFSFATGFADYAATTGAFVPTQATIFDPRLWSALPVGEYTIDLDHSTGQVLQTGTTTVGTGEIAVNNTPDGKVVASLKQYLDFGPGVYTQTASALASLTIDIYGRVVGFTLPDYFYFTADYQVATASQTVFTVTRSAGYISGQCLVFQNGVLLDTSEYTDTAGSTGTVTLNTGVPAGTQICIMSFKSVAYSGGATYASFTRSTYTLTNDSAYTPTSINSGYELLFLNGVCWTEQDYDIVGGVLTNFPSVVTGQLTVIEWTPNNLTTPNGNPVNSLINSVIGQTFYVFNYTSGALNIYMNGVLLTQGTDYTAVSNGYTLTNTPTTVVETQLQQTFARTGAV